MSGKQMLVVASDGGGWDHVSVSFTSRVPSYEEMEFVRRMWFDDAEWVVQYSPPFAERINNHAYCLHLWRWQEGAFPTPPASMVGIRGIEPVLN